MESIGVDGIHKLPSLDIKSRLYCGDASRRVGFLSTISSVDAYHCFDDLFSSWIVRFIDKYSSFEHAPDRSHHRRRLTLSIPSSPSIDAIDPIIAVD